LGKRKNHPATASNVSLEISTKQKKRREEDSKIPTRGALRGGRGGAGGKTGDKVMLGGSEKGANPYTDDRSPKKCKITVQVAGNKIGGRSLKGEQSVKPHP